jgi:large subunit ribosomal protein L21e
MLKRKNIKTRGKIPFSTFFQKFKEGDSVALVKELSLNASFNDRMQGRTGKVVGKRGSAYIVQVKDLGMMKQFTIKPVHLKKITS